MSEFVHLHVHSEYSLLDGLSKVSTLVERAAELKMPALALTDHGAMYAAIDFYRVAKRAGIKPIIGMESYLTPLGRKMTDRLPGQDDTRYHLLLLAYNQEGYQNLLKIASAAQLEGFYYRPRVDREFLEAHSRGLIATSGCLAAEVPRLLETGNHRAASERIGWYADVFGHDRFFLELQEHGIPELSAVNRELVRLAEQFDLKLVATNDVHYAQAEDAQAHDVLLCVQTGNLVTEQNRMRMSDNSYYLKSYEEMQALFGERPDALTNTLLIAEMCEVDLASTGYHLPAYPVPEGFTPESYLRHLVDSGLERRFGARAATSEIQERKAYELQIIHNMGFDDYFLIVWDLCEFARRREIWWNVRGSGAGSLVAYAIGITNIDPLRNQLFFERFLNPGRVSMPDIDLDFPDDRREEMINYTVEKYGKDCVAQIITFGTMGARAAIRDVGRALDIPLPEVDRIAKLIPPMTKVHIAEAIEKAPELKQLYETHDYIRTLVDTAAQLEGVARHASTHAAGVVIADKPLVAYTPLHRPTRGAGDEGAVTQYPMEILESIGLLKIDFLGLSTLTVMRLACELIYERRGRRLDLTSIPYQRCPEQSELDAEVVKLYDLLASGDVTGIFQVESAGMRRVLKKMRPRQFEHIVATISLYRPGPMEYIDSYIARMHGQEEVTYLHPSLEPILAETYGIIVYQEQIMQIASQLSGYTPGEADLMRRAVGKKKKEALLRHRTKFVAGAVERDIQEDVAHRIFDDIEYFARYGFNKAHAAAYAMITCQTAYLKAHYPAEYMAALLTVERHNTDKIGMLVGEARAMNIDILPPDVNKSADGFTIENHEGNAAIRFGLAAIKNVGEGPVQLILEERGRDGPFADIDDFCCRIDLRLVNRRALESLIKVGALSPFGGRSQLLAIVERMMGLSAQSHRASAVGQTNLFDLEGFETPLGGSILHPLPEVEEVSRREILEWEKSLIGAYVSEHPLQPYLPRIRQAVTCFLGEIDESMHNQAIVVAGLVTSWRQVYTRNNSPMAFVEIGDLQGTIEVVVFPRVYEQCQHLIEDGRLLVVRGRVSSERSESPKILAESISDELTAYHPVSGDEALLPAPSKPRSVISEKPVIAGQPVQRASSRRCHLHITIPRTESVEADKRRLKEVYGTLIEYPGHDRFTLYLPLGEKQYRMHFPNTTTRDCSELRHRLEELLGASCIRVDQEVSP